MLLVPWLFAVSLVCVCSPSICSDLSSKERLLDCIDQCASRIQAELPKHGSVVPGTDEEGILLNMLLATLSTQDKTQGPRVKGKNEDRHSYAMEHFRWGKPPGRKRRPIKVFASSGEGDDAIVEPRQVRRRSGSVEDVGKRDLLSQPLQSVTFGPKPGSLLSPQEIKDTATYRMTHFRWGSPPKRQSTLLKPLSRFFGNALKLVQ